MTLAIAAAIGVAGCGSDGAKPSPADTVLAGTIVVTAPASADSSPIGRVEISVTVGVDSSPDRVESIPLGAVVALSITDPNAAQEYHVHGYELGSGVKIAVGVPEVFQFTADKAGEFEVESHTTETVLVTLRVG